MADRMIEGERVTLRHGWGGDEKKRNIALIQRIHSLREKMHHPEPGKFDITGQPRINAADYSLFPQTEEI